MLLQFGSLILVGILWGATNPLIKRGSKGIVHIKGNNKIKQLLLEWKYLFTNINYIIPLIVNQLGSVFYFFVLQSSDLSLAVPVANSLSFVFTAISGWALGEKLPDRSALWGIALILLGSMLCCSEKQHR
ncbi:transmembrane protein 234 homolog isoform X2 [Agrilus planipennis]|uniref:Transmembrane protein 234 homolog isoform X2 n=1 Tax=Agrilus planipennis TaxID=224129 RepID=A0A1W4X7Z4_AGRPL|nr:transmembrane protein 234 homolog isoform X2 [Agrilus planipennis]